MEGSPKLSGLYYPDRFGRILLTGLEEIMGRNGLNAILNLANLSQFIDNPPPDSMDRNFDFAYISALNQALEDMLNKINTLQHQVEQLQDQADRTLSFRPVYLKVASVRL